MCLTHMAQHMYIINISELLCKVLKHNILQPGQIAVKKVAESRNQPSQASVLQLISQVL